MSLVGKKIVNQIFGILMIFLIILLLPIIFPIALVISYIDTRKMNQLIKRFICVSCGKQLGAEEIQLGNERWDSIVSEMLAKYPNRKFRRPRSIHAVCPHCGCEYRYNKGNNTLELIPQKENA
ncbi:MAG: hypothetical protein K0U86_08465 [Planctomycetes bacterium]|nr:hypothetical protein [Planctomycetota bacterium]MCH9724922.1 hypothetical protein [Planctomycetota bacterium]MCH9776881.1 hypothetical protein [Planctomycetota bacterium]